VSGSTPNHLRAHHNYSARQVDPFHCPRLTPVFQVGYTTLFGWFAACLFICIGSVLRRLVSNVFCNVMGIYLPGTAVARHPEQAPDESDWTGNLDEPGLIRSALDGIFDRA